MRLSFRRGYIFMETARRVSLQWIPEDDLLLRNAVEAGASLEALAKGAVQFSRRYTLQELRERWYSLLYDDDISVQASYHMFELEISGISPASKYRPESSCARNKDVKRPRKPESIRKKYYAMRKRLRADFSSDINMEFFGDSRSDHFALRKEDIDVLKAAFPEAVEDVSVDFGDGNVPPDLFFEGHQNRIMGGFGFSEKLVSPSREARDNNSGVHVECSLSVRKSEVDETLRNSLGDFDVRPQFHSPNSDCFSSFDAMVFPCGQTQLETWTAVEDVKPPSLPDSLGFGRTPESAENLDNANVAKETSETVSTGEIAGPDSLLNLTNEVESLLVDFVEKPAVEDKIFTHDVDSIHKDSVNDSQELAVVGDGCQVQAVPEVSLRVSNVDDPLTLENPSFSVCQDQEGLQSSVDLPSKPDFAVSTDDKVCCVLNMEDLEIPCNDDIFLLIHPTAASFPSETRHAALSPYATSPFEKDHEAPFNLLTRETTRSVLDHTASRLADSLVKKDFHGHDIKAPGTLPSAAEIMQSAEAVSARLPHPEFEVESPVSDLEDSQMDDDVPYFSDVESLILDMDLGPYDQDSHINRRVPSYQYDETKRTIIRLEQGARSCLQRAMTSQGAFAILYGRYLRHYIKKTEVLLGRSTEETAVDIDLAREGPANKISRRQAIIKMEADGSFFMKNLGRRSISLNGTTVLSGQVVSLCSGSLIEIKEMSFVFEINHSNVKKHLGNLSLNSKKEEQC